MGVSASVFCRDCRQFAPTIWDFGAVGFPSLDDTPSTTAGYQMFGYLQKPFDDLGYKPWELEATAAFLRTHVGHDVSLFLEGEDVKRDRHTDRDSGVLSDVSDTTRFAFDDRDFVNGFYCVTCKKCDETVRYGPQRLRNTKPQALTTPRINLFLERVRSSDGTNFHRGFGLLDYYGDQEAFAAFLTKHKGHAPTAAIIQAESWHADKSRPELPWRLAWSKDEHFPSRCEPLIAGDRIFVISGPDTNRKEQSPSALHCFDLSGAPLWRHELPGAVTVRPEATPAGLVVQCGLPGEPLRFNVLGFDPQNGNPLWSAVTSYAIASWLPGHEGFIGIESIYSEPVSRRIAAVSLPTLTPRWVWVDPAKDFFEGVDNRTVAATTDAVLMAGGNRRTNAGWARCLDSSTGHERWFTALSEFGSRSTADVLPWREFLLLKGGTQLIALDILDGHVAWTAEVPMWSWHQRDDLLLGHAQGVGAFDLQERRLRFLVEFNQFGAAPTPLPEQFSLRARLTLAGDEILMVDLARGRLWGLDAATGLPLWMQRPAHGVTGNYPALAGNHLVIQGPGLCCYVRSEP